MEIREIVDGGEILRWRELTLREVFHLPPDYDMSHLLAANAEYLSQDEECFVMVEGVETEGEGGLKIGCGAICLQRELPSPDNPTGLVAYIMNIYVVPVFRRHGFGHGIVRHLVELASRRGVGKIMLETTKEAHSLYAGLGFKPADGYIVKFLE